MDVKVLSGGHTFTMGNFAFAIGKVSIAVEIGLILQASKDWLMVYPAIENPEITMANQPNLLIRFLVVDK